MESIIARQGLAPSSRGRAARADAARRLSRLLLLGAACLIVLRMAGLG